MCIVFTLDVYSVYSVWVVLTQYAYGAYTVCVQCLHCMCTVCFCFVFGQFSEQLWLLKGQVEDSTAGDYFFYPLTGTELGSQPSLTTRDRELVSVLEVRIEPGDLNQRPLTPQSVTLPTLPRAGCRVVMIYAV